MNDVRKIFSKSNGAGSNNQRCLDAGLPHKQKAHQLPMFLPVGNAVKIVSSSCQRVSCTELAPDHGISKSSKSAKDPCPQKQAVVELADHERHHYEWPNAHHIDHVDRSSLQ